MRPDFGRAGIEAAHAFIDWAHAVLAPPQEVRALESRDAKRASLALAGLAVLADWIGSRQEWFPYREPVEDLESYWSIARDRATRAVIEAGVVPAGASRDFDYGNLLGGHVTPSPMQRWARDVGLPAGPALFLIEDETGSGKTEAALMLAHRLMEDGAADGLYVALPTMATANAMFDRLATAYRHLFAPGAEPSLALAHGARDMHDGFRDAMPRGGRYEASYSGAFGADEAFERPRPPPAPSGLPTKGGEPFWPTPAPAPSIKRCWRCCRADTSPCASSDSAAAFSSWTKYTRTMPTCSARWSACSSSRRGSEVPQFCSPQRCRCPFVNASRSPSRTGWSRRPATRIPPWNTPWSRFARPATLRPRRWKGRSDRARMLPVRFLRSTDEALEVVRREALAGKAVLYIRNSVDDALDAHAALRANGIEPELFTPDLLWWTVWRPKGAS